MNLEGECVRLFIICQTQKRSIEFHRLDLQLVFTCYSKGVVNHGSGIVFISPFPEVFLKVQARNQSLSQLGKKGGGGRVGEVFTTVKSTSDSIRSPHHKVDILRLVPERTTAAVEFFLENTSGRTSQPNSSTLL